jgi:hypothetical protein
MPRLPRDVSKLSPQVLLTALTFDRIIFSFHPHDLEAFEKRLIFLTIPSPTAIRNDLYHSQWLYDVLFFPVTLRLPYGYFTFYASFFRTIWNVTTSWAEESRVRDRGCPRAFYSEIPYTGSVNSKSILGGSPEKGVSKRRQFRRIFWAINMDQLWWRWTTTWEPTLCDG